MIQLIITFYCKFIDKKTNNIDYIKFKDKDSFFKWKQKKHITILSEWIEWVYILKNNIYTFKWNENIAKIHNNKISHLNSIEEIENYLLSL
jgi:hypothetical protein